MSDDVREFAGFCVGSSHEHRFSDHYQSDWNEIVRFGKGSWFAQHEEGTSIGVHDVHSDAVWSGIVTTLQIVVVLSVLIFVAGLGAVVVKLAMQYPDVSIPLAVGSVVLVCWIYGVGYARTQLADDVDEWKSQ